MCSKARHNYGYERKTDRRKDHARAESHNRASYRESSKGQCATEQPRKLPDESQNRVAKRVYAEYGSNEL